MKNILISPALCLKITKSPLRNAAHQGLHNNTNSMPQFPFNGFFYFCDSFGQKYSLTFAP
jgi:hypothetical protein